MKKVQKAIKKIDFVYFSDFFSQNFLGKRVHISHFGLLLQEITDDRAQKGNKPLTTAASTHYTH